MMFYLLIASHPRTPQKPPQKPQLIKKNKVKRQKQSLKTNFEVCVLSEISIIVMAKSLCKHF